MERWKECVCVCVCKRVRQGRERERERERERAEMSKLGQQNYPNVYTLYMATPFNLLPLALHLRLHALIWT